jgi:hypothetical protein
VKAGVQEFAKALKTLPPFAGMKRKEIKSIFSHHPSGGGEEIILGKQRRQE